MITMDDDDIFMGSPRSKFYDIIYNANRNLVADELDRMLSRYIALEALLEEKGVSEEELDHHEKTYPHANNIDNRLMSLYLELTGNIVTRNE